MMAARRFLVAMTLAGLSACGPSTTVQIPSDSIPDAAPIISLGQAIVDKGTESFGAHPGDLEAACRVILNATINDTDVGVTTLGYLTATVNALTSPRDQHVAMRMLTDVTDSMEKAFNRVMLPKSSGNPCADTYLYAATSVDLIRFGGAAARSAVKLHLAIIVAR